MRAQGGDPDEDALPRRAGRARGRRAAARARRARSARSASASRRCISAPAGATKEDAIDHAVGVVCLKQARRRRRGGRAARRDPRARRGVAPRRRRRRPRRVRARRRARRPSGRSLLERAPPTAGEPCRRRTCATLARCPSCPRSRPSAASSSRCSTGGASTHVEIGDARLTRPLRSRRGRRRARRASASRRVERRGKYLIVRFESGRVLLDPPPDDGQLPARAGGRSADDPHRRAVVRLDDGSDVAYRDVRRFGTWLLLEPGRARRLPRRAARRGAARARASRRARSRDGSRGRRAPIKAALLDQRTLAGHREHLRRRGALARADPSAAPGAASSTRRRSRACTAAIRAALELGIARQGATLRDYRQPDGARGLDAARVQGLRPRRRAVRPLRHADREDPRRRPRHVVLPGVPAAAERRLGGEQLVERGRRGRAARARCSRRSAGRRSGSAAPSSRPVSS